MDCNNQGKSACGLKDAAGAAGVDNDRTGHLLNWLLLMHESASRAWPVIPQTASLKRNHRPIGRCDLNTHAAICHIDHGANALRRSGFCPSAGEYGAALSLDPTKRAVRTDDAVDGGKLSGAGC